MNERDILDLVREDGWMMHILREAPSLKLPNWMIGAGFVRNKVWDYLHGYKNKKVQTADIDFIYFDPNKTSQKNRYGTVKENVRENGHCLGNCKPSIYS